MRLRSVQLHYHFTFEHLKRRDRFADSMVPLIYQKPLRERRKGDEQMQRCNRLYLPFHVIPLVSLTLHSYAVKNITAGGLKDLLNEAWCNCTLSLYLQCNNFLHAFTTQITADT